MAPRPDIGVTITSDLEVIDNNADAAESSMAKSKGSTIGQQGEETETSSSWCNIHRIVCILVGAVFLIAGLVALLTLYVGGDPTQFFVMEDPPGKSETNLWGQAGRGEGLTLLIMNSCEDKWDEIFDEAVTDWDNGNPDPLSLTTRKYAHDPDCEPNTGRINVCNGNYGETAWRGINTVFMDFSNYVVWSTAKLNDYWLETESRNQKRYTMCHEIGHGFGLPHTDENYFNMDRGDCMDYTTRPQNNLDPGTFNLEILADIYGVVGGAADGSTGGIQLSQNDNSPSLPERMTRPPVNEDDNDKKDKDKKDKDKKDKDRRYLRSLSDGTESDPTTTTDVEIPQEVIEKYFTALKDIENGSCVGTEGGRRLHSNEHGEGCHVDLGGGYSMLTHKLMVSPSERKGGIEWGLDQVSEP